MSEADELVGRSLADRYRIDEPLARGGMARVFRARDERLDRDVAVKVLSSPYAEDAAFTQRFLDEARAVASLSHPSLVHVYDSGSDGGVHFIVMELLDRHRSLRQVLDERGALPRQEVMTLAQELLAGLRVVHERGLVHCDVKTGNVMLGPGAAKLIDFGIAQPPHDGDPGDTSIGSLRSMSPEQLHGEALTPASDLFSLGAVLYEALTGRPPFAGATPGEVSAAHEAGAVPPPSTLVEGIPGRLDDAILQSLRRDPASRFRSADAMSVALATAADAPPEIEPTEGRDDETRVIRTQRPSADVARPAGSAEGAGYVPPPAPAPVPIPYPSTPPPRATRAARAERRPAGRAWSLVATVAVLAAAAIVVVLVVVPLLEIGRGGGAGGASPSASAAQTPEPGNSVVVPEFIGMSTVEAIDAATAAGLDWKVHCNQDPQRPEGIIDQEPPAGAEVRRGSRMNLYSARIQDCR